MKYPMEYWTGRMSGILSHISRQEGLDDDVKLTCEKVVEEFEKDYESD